MWSSRLISDESSSDVTRVSVSWLRLKDSTGAELERK